MPDRQPSGTRQKLPSLTGLRFYAAALVFCFHTSLTKMVDPFADRDFADGYGLLFGKAGWAGVSFFFILSGFVLAWSARPGERLGPFYRRRLLKIYPNHVVTWALTLLLFSSTVGGVSVWLPNLFLVHSWIPRLDTFVSVNQPSWSLCSELLFYLLFPLLWRWVKNLRSGRLWAWFAVTFAGLLLTQIVIDTLVPATPRLTEWPLSETQWWLAYNIPPLRLFEFVLGMLMARILREGRWIGLGIAPALALTGAGYALALAVPWQYGLNVTLAVPLALLVTAVAAADVTGRPTGLRGRAMTLLGEVSFAFYLVHYLVLLAVQDLLDGRRFATPVALAVLAVAFVVAQLLGWLLYAAVERPVMRRWAGRPRKREDTPASGPAPGAPRPVTQRV
ncbi:MULTISPECIES: acyltransferase family protein [Streptomyces]|uniref:Acyltransferase family protein n=1 Tax=Streptomyces eurythermus TaxID=42237 RepID=A0ABW6YXW9_9ACTN|nr:MULTISPECIES: acyltransferase [Streptomyces]WDM10293.1 acyltransferase [Streptomyces lavenduligriseus]